MRYFHRTSVPPDAVIAAADRFFGDSMTRAEEGPRHRVFTGTIGRIAVNVGMEGGHYVRVQLNTDQLAESEADKRAKRFMGVVHTLAEPAHELRGSY